MTAGGSEISIDVVIPTHDGLQLTQTCLEHLRLQTAPHSTIVVDDASTDGTLLRLRDAFPDVRVVRLAVNSGFAIACNAGARAGSGDVVVLINNDVECPPDFLERLVAPFCADPRLGSVAAVLLDAERRTIDSVGLAVDRTLAGFPRLRGHALGEARSGKPVLAGPAGAAGAYRRTAWDQVGGLDEHVFMYGEDVDLALRLRAEGWRTVVEAEAVAVHRGSASIRHRSARQRYHSGFARGYFLRRYGVLNGNAAVRATGTEAIVVVGDAILSRDLAATRGRIAGWRAAAGLNRRPPPPPAAVDAEITFGDSLRLRRRSYAP